MTRKQTSCANTLKRPYNASWNINKNEVPAV